MDNVDKNEDFLSRMQGLLDNAKKQGHIILRVEDLENTFPELHESEDEKIRKKLIEAIKGDMVIGGAKDKQRAIAWLEKQGEKPQGKSSLEAINEVKIDNKNCVKSTDKVKPKFKEGDWITNGEYTWKIISVDYLDYTLQNQDGENDYDTINYVDKAFHLWTIQDAKDGDVLHSPSNHIIWIYKDNEHYHVCVNMNYRTKNVSIDGSIVISNDACPSTKDEQTILFANMKKLGYKWFANKKELRKEEIK